MTVTKGGNTDACPVTKETWEARAAIKDADCGGQSVYHCLSDSKGWKWERCVEKTKIIGGQCPIFTADGYIDWQPCNTTISMCPNNTYVSNEVYQFPICFGENIPREKIAKDTDDDAEIVVAIVVPVIAVIAIIASILFIFHFRRNRRQRDQRKSNQSTNQTKSDETEELLRPRDPIVESGLKALSREDGKSLFVHGKFGNSVSSTSRSILEKFVEENEDWKSQEYRYTDIPDNVEENTVMFVYGWFGLWNDDPCSVDKVKKACQDLNNILSKYTNVKIIIGMRSEHHRKYHALGCFTRSTLFRNELSLDSENIEKYEELFQYFKEKIKEPCQKEECHCHDLKFETFKSDLDSEIGIPLKMNVLEKYHNVIDDYMIKGSLLTAMTDHITSLEGDKETKNIYQWIMYICLKGQYNRSEELDTELIRSMEFRINKLSFTEDLVSKYIVMRNSDQQKKVPPESAMYVFWHPFIYTCAFHSLFRTKPDTVMKYCNIDAILQLVRPANHLDTYMEVRADEAMIDLFNQRILEEGLQDVCKNHPLVIPPTDTEENTEDVEQSIEEEPREQHPLIMFSQVTMNIMHT